MALPQPDVEFLDSRGLAYTVSEEGGMTCVVFSNHKLPAGLNVASADLLIRLSPGFPDIPPDMWWFSPGVTRPDGQVIPATEVIEQHLGRSWQRGGLPNSQERRRRASSKSRERVWKPGGLRALCRLQTKCSTCRVINYDHVGQL